MKALHHIKTLGIVAALALCVALAVGISSSRAYAEMITPPPSNSEAQELLLQSIRDIKQGDTLANMKKEGKDISGLLALKQASGAYLGSPVHHYNLSNNQLTLEEDLYPVYLNKTWVATLVKPRNMPRASYLTSDFIPSSYKQAVNAFIADNSSYAWVSAPQTRSTLEKDYVVKGWITNQYLVGNKTVRALVPSENESWGELVPVANVSTTSSLAELSPVFDSISKSAPREHMTYVSFASQAWQQNGGFWYLVDANGKPLTGWQRVDGAWYYFDDLGKMQTGWISVSGTWYFMNNTSTGTYGALQTGWISDGYNWYLLDSSGALLSGWQAVNSPLSSSTTWYYLNPSHDGTYGAMKTGWIYDGANWYLLDHTGAMLSGWQKAFPSATDEPGWYYLDEQTTGTNGAMQTGWHSINGAWYYLEPASNGLRGLMLTGWQYINGAWYLLDSSGALI